MAAPTLAQFRARFPEFEPTDDSAVEGALTRAQRHHARTLEGWLLAAAHLLALDGDRSTVGGYDGGAGEVSAETLGPEQVEYETMAGGKPERVFYTTTRYGRELLALEARTPALRVSAVAVG